MILCVIDQITEISSEEEFSKIFEQISEFCIRNYIHLNAKVRQRRKTTIATRFKDCLVTGTLGQREVIGSEGEYRSRIFYPVIDSILVQMNDHFLKSNVEILCSICSL